MKIYIARDRGTHDDSTYVMCYKDNIENYVNPPGEVEDLELKEGAVTFSVQLESMNCFELDPLFSKSEPDPVCPEGGYLELFPGIFDKVKDYCESMCLYGKGSDTCNICPLKGACDFIIHPGLSKKN